MSYLATYSAATDAEFQGRCLVAMWKAAQDILVESTDAPEHQARADWANTVLKERTIISPRLLAIQVLRNGTIAANPTAAADGDIQFQVNSIIADLMKIG